MKKFIETLVSLVCALMVIAGIVGLLARTPLVGVIPQLRGTTPMVVMSGSMVPRLPVGGLVFVHPVGVASVAVGDIIAFVEPGTSGKDAQLTSHRVIRIGHDDSGQLAFIVKGDANPTADPRPVPAASVVGVAGLAIPYLGFLASFVRQPAGFIAFIVIPALFIVAEEGRAIADEVARVREEHAESLDRGLGEVDPAA